MLQAKRSFIQRRSKTAAMPNAPDVTKTQMVIRLKRTLKRRLEGEAAETGSTVTDLVSRLLGERLSHVKLSIEDRKAIARSIKQALVRRPKRGG